MTERPVSNPLALAVLACLFERPMHPYEISTTLRERHKDESIKLNYGSLYSVVEALLRNGLIEPRETEREGRRPERTVYGLTDAGRFELVDWLSELLSTPAKEFLHFEAGLCLMGVLPPEDIVALLDERCRRLESEDVQAASLRALYSGLPRLFWIEEEHREVLRRAELAWTRGLRDEVAAGTIGGYAEWVAFQAGHRAALAGADTNDEIASQEVT